VSFLASSKNQVMQRSPIEFLSRDDIARRAEEMLLATFGGSVNPLKPAPLQRLIETFEKNKWLTFSHDQDLGELPGQRKIYGEFRVEPIQILIDKSLEPWSPRFCFSVAHEIGHFALHRKKIGIGKYINREQLPADSASRLRYRDMATLSDLGWAEWQANEFALALIMPVYSLQQHVRKIQQDLGINRNLGIIYLDHQACNRVDCGLILGHLLHKYQVSHTLLRRRLRHLNILHDRRPTRRNNALKALGSLFHSEGED
jgi:Zn-dependent peptidase ImmA (M78 family)